MDKQKFNIGSKVMHKGNVCVVRNAAYTYFPHGAWWVYELDNGIFVVSANESDIDGMDVPKAEEKPVRTKGNGKKRKR
jgi:hypothetical protein